MNNVPAISIVMPVYNVEKYLRECLDSVRAQTFTDWECICVDDGSTDASSAILNEYAANDSRFCIIRSEHSNAGAARNVGMTNATGDYLAFLDSDDVFSPWMLETLLDKAEEVEADIAACWFTRFCDGEPLPPFRQAENIEWEDRTPDPDWSKVPSRLSTMPWNKIVKRSFVEKTGLRFLEQSCTNDMTFELLALSLSRKSVQTWIPLVAYRGRKKSIQARKSKNPEHTLGAIDAYFEEMEKRNAFCDISPVGMSKILFFFGTVFLWELKSQTTAAGYYRLYCGIKTFHVKWEDLWEGVSPLDNAETARYWAIVRGGVKERFRALCEALFSPILGNKDRQSHFSRKIATRISRLIHIFFESSRLPWNRNISK